MPPKALFALQNILYLLNNMPRPMLLCDSCLQTIYANKKLNHYYRTKYPPLSELVSGANLKRIQDAQKTERSIEVPCTGYIEKKSRLRVYWLKTADCGCIYMIGEIHSEQNKDAEQNMRISAMIAAGTEQIENSLQQLFMDISILATLVPDDPQSKEQARLVNMRRSILRIARNTHHLRNAAAPAPLSTSFQDFRKMLHTIVREARKYALRKSISIALDAPNDIIPVFCDSEQMSRAILNILANVLYFTPSNSELKIEMRQSERKLSVSIRDDGNGIPRYYMERMLTSDCLFEDGQQITGLYFASDIIRRHGGNIFISESEFQESRIVFELPIDHADVTQLRQPSASTLEDLVACLAQIEMSIL